MNTTPTPSQHPLCSSSSLTSPSVLLTSLKSAGSLLTVRLLDECEWLCDFNTHECFARLVSSSRAHQPLTTHFSEHSCWRHSDQDQRLRVTVYSSHVKPGPGIRVRGLEKPDFHTKNAVFNHQRECVRASHSVFTAEMKQGENLTELQLWQKRTSVIRKLSEHDPERLNSRTESVSNTQVVHTRFQEEPNIKPSVLGYEENCPTDWATAAPFILFACDKIK